MTFSSNKECTLIEVMEDQLITHQGTSQHHSDISLWYWLETSPGTHHSVVWMPDPQRNIQKEEPENTNCVNGNQ